MGQLSNVGAWRDVTFEEFAKLGVRAAAFLPHLIGAVLILLIGWAVSALIAFVAQRGLRAVGVDRLGARHRIAERAGLRVPLSEALGRVVFWLLMVTFILSSLHTLGLASVSATLDRLVAYVPNLVGAVLIGAFGLLVARFAGSIAASAAAAADFPGAHRLGFLVQALSIGLVVIVTLEQLGLSTEVLVGPLTAVLAAGGLASGLAFALGARPVITHILAGHFLKQSLPRDSFVEIDGQRGVVERIGPTDTLLADGEKKWSIPNAQLLEHVVVRTGPAPV